MTIERQTIIHKGNDVPQEQCGNRFWERVPNTRREQKPVTVFRKTVRVSHIEYKKGSFLSSDVVSENRCLLEKKYLVMKDVFLVENRILDNKNMSLVSTQKSTQTRVRT